MPQPAATKEPYPTQPVNTDKTTSISGVSLSSPEGIATTTPKLSRSLLFGQTPEPFVEANAAAEFLHYSSRTIKQMAREGRIPAHPFGAGVRKRWYFLISELAEYLRRQVNSAHGEAGRDKTQRRVI
jgi:hypothetical protein